MRSAMDAADRAVFLTPGRTSVAAGGVNAVLLRTARKPDAAAGDRIHDEPRAKLASRFRGRRLRSDGADRNNPRRQFLREKSGQVSSFVQADFKVPTLVEATDFKIVPLGPEVVQLDFDACMSSIEHLQKSFSRSTRWPRPDITAADAMQDMENEQARFKGRKSFAFAVLTPDGSRGGGSVYVSPKSRRGL